jgi:hypothetical protein
MLEALWEFFRTWLALFYAPFQNTDMLWIIVPIYLSWIITEIFQEKRDTTFGNAISNGTIVLWVGIDWVRTTVRLFEEGGMAVNGMFYAKICIGMLVFVYGLLIMYLGIRGNRTVKYIARIREVSYILICFTPIFYEPALLSFAALLGIVVFFPLFYFFVEFLDWITPDPKTYDLDSSHEPALYRPVTKGPPKTNF